MNKFFLLIFLIVHTTLSVAQSDPTLGQASSFAVLASSSVSNTGVTGVTGNLGIGPGNTINDTGELYISGIKELGNEFAAEAQRDAKAAYDNLSSKPVTGTLPAQLNNFLISPGVYKINGDASLSGILQLDAGGNINSTFIFIVKGSLRSTMPAPPSPSTGLLLQNGAQPKNVYWIVEEEVELGGSTIFQGNIIAQKNITLNTSVGLIGRAISLGGSISLNTNNIYLPSVVITDLSVEKAALEGDYSIGSTITYTIKARNAGPGTASNVIVTENFSGSELKFMSATPQKGTFKKDADGKYRWYVGSLLNNEEVTLTVVFKILAIGNIKNQVVIIGDKPDPNPNDNEKEEPVDVTPPKANLSIQKKAEAGDYKIGDEVKYTVVARNNGPSNATGVSVQENVPAGLELVSATPDKGTYNAATNQWAIGNLANNEEVKLVLVFKITQAGALVNSVNIIGDNPDPDPEDNDDNDPIDVTCPAVQIALNGETNLCGITGNLTYTVTEVPGGAYAFDLPEDWVLISQIGNRIVVKPSLASGEIVATVKDKCDNEVKAALNVNVAFDPTLPTIVGEGVICSLNTDVAYEATGVDGNVQYNWSVTGDLVIVSGQNTKSVVIRATSVAGGVLSVRARNACAVLSEVATKVIGVSELPSTPVAILGAANVCATDEVTYKVEAVPGAGTYTWSAPGSWTVVSETVNNEFAEFTVKPTSSGTVKVTISNSCGNSTESTLSVNVSQKPAAPAITGNNKPCVGTEVTYSVTSPASGVTYTWNITGQLAKVRESATTVTVLVNGEGNIKVTGSNNCGAGEATTVVIPAPAAATGPIQDNSNVCDGLSFSTTAVAGATSYTWAVPEGFTITAGQGTTSIKVKMNNSSASGQVTVVANNEASCSNAVSSAVINTKLANGELNFPKAFSPNGDNRNETWEVENLLNFPENEVVIFNRWGSEVYKKQGYKNDWNGGSLENGTYFYKAKVKLCGGVEKVFTGYVTIFR